MKTFRNIAIGSLLAAGNVHGFSQDRTSEMTGGSRHLGFGETLERNEGRVAVLKSGCRLDDDKLKDLDFPTLHKIQYNTTNSLDIDHTFLNNVDNNFPNDKNSLNKFQLVDLFRLEKNHIMACLPPKAGTTNWQRYFAGLNDSEKEPEEFKVPQVFHEIPRVLKEKKSLEESLEDASEYTRLVNTRHPFARLLSGWRQKFEKTFYNAPLYVKRYGRKILKFNDEAPDSHHYSFKQFLYYVANEDMARYDYHWQSITYQCMPCSMQYDVIVQQETSASDAEFFTEFKNLEDKTHLPGQYKDSPLLSSSLVDQYRGLPRSLIEKLYKIYFYDFLLFGYSIDEFVQVSDIAK